ncbi:carboxymuconolactone decarboxylase family protein [Nesterenkonia ebinurensis]|uniref:carboxymuconolactone decarboxylase family protein n=1 Tax=Nesterenkonia ebinurensis TaxID=2608252 RepID=UPI00123CFB56|nr:carboxymuconolactone decarboxylase family protein [Nesterenkonia ebinurensis]
MRSTINNASISSSARIPLDRSGPLASFVGWFSQRVYGRVLDPLRVGLHHRGVLFSTLGLELAASRWKKLPKDLQALAVMASAQEIGCTWCLDFGYWENYHQGVDPEKLRQVPLWKTSDVHTPLERVVIEYSVAATNTPPTVTDEMVARLREDLDDEQIVELTAWVSLENYRSRTNSSMGLTGQGFKAECDIQGPGEPRLER